MAGASENNESARSDQTSKSQELKAAMAMADEFAKSKIGQFTKIKMPRVAANLPASSRVARLGQAVNITGRGSVNKSATVNTEATAEGSVDEEVSAEADENADENALANSLEQQKEQSRSRARTLEKNPEEPAARPLTPVKPPTPTAAPASRGRKKAAASLGDNQEEANEAYRAQMLKDAKQLALWKQQSERDQYFAKSLAEYNQRQKLIKGRLSDEGKGSAKILQDSWMSLITSFGTSIIPLDMMLFAGKIDDKICKIGHEWIPDEIYRKDPVGSFKKGERIAILEKGGLCCINGCCAIIVLGMAAVVIVALIALNPALQIKIILNVVWNYIISVF